VGGWAARKAILKKEEKNRQKHREWILESRFRDRRGCSIAGQVKGKLGNITTMVEEKISPLVVEKPIAGKMKQRGRSLGGEGSSSVSIGEKGALAGLLRETGYGGYMGGKLTEGHDKRVGF